jgi:uncharacterized protein
VKHAISVFLFTFFLALSAFSQDIVGEWHGNIDVSGRSIPIVFHFFKDESGKPGGKWDSPSQGAMGLPFSGINVSQDSLNLSISAINGSYNGKFINADSIAGIWHQGAANLPLNFVRFKSGEIASHQGDNYPGEKEISITSNGYKLYGTLLSRNISQPLVIIVAGSGPTDRNGNNPLGDKANSYRLLARALDSANIASFRFDKRGIGESKEENFNEASVTFDDYVMDVENIYEFLKDSLGFNRIYFAGHSEGSLIGILAAEKCAVQGLISLSGAGRSIDKVIEEQLDKQAISDSLKREIDSIFIQLKNGQEVKDVPKPLLALFRHSIQPYFISWLKYDPAKEIAKLHCRVLIIQGSCDKQVSQNDAELLHNANTKNSMVLIPGMTHTLKNAGVNCVDENDASYLNPDLPLNRELVLAVESFIKKDR